MSAWGDVRPAGYAATAAEFLNQAAADHVGLVGPSVPERQLAALQGIGWALLAIVDQLADADDAVADCATQLSETAAAVGDLYREPFGDRVRGVLASLPRARKARLR